MDAAPASAATGVPIEIARNIATGRFSDWKRSARTGFVGAGFFQAVEKTDALPKCACGTVNASWVRVSVSPSDGFPGFGSVQPRRFWPPVNRISYSEPSAYSTKTLRQCRFIVQAEVFRKKSHGAFLPFMSMRTCS